ncbi:MAG: hypothetical protein KatS3mg115_1343 [Candidatus Poribacteria bacterium]|nr:MAG: hypothetical protein KatS3mg115_1343 [Candidatus Poribacteria bacterium]
MSQPLRFRPDGTFTIVQFTDTHWTNADAEDAHTREILECVLEHERPDLVAWTGGRDHRRGKGPGAGLETSR